MDGIQQVAADLLEQVAAAAPSKAPQAGAAGNRRRREKSVLAAAPSPPRPALRAADPEPDNAKRRLRYQWPRWAGTASRADTAERPGWKVIGGPGAGSWPLEAAQCHEAAQQRCSLTAKEQMSCCAWSCGSNRLGRATTAARGAWRVCDWSLAARPPRPSQRRPYAV